MNPNEPNHAADAGLQHQNSSPKVVGRPFKPGVSGNPSGRRRGAASLTAALKRKLTRQAAEQIAAKIVDRARQGDRHAWAIILQRCDEFPLPGDGVPPVAMPHVQLIIPDNGRGGTYPPSEPEIPHIPKARMIEILNMLEKFKPDTPAHDQ